MVYYQRTKLLLYDYACEMRNVRDFIYRTKFILMTYCNPIERINYTK